MIVDRVEYAADYAAQLPHLADALRLMKEMPQLSPGKHLCPGGYFMYQTGTTRAVSESGFEAHRDYIDVQILLQGRELILWNRLENMEETVPYDPQTDKQGLRGKGSVLEMQPGMFCALFPGDAHTACRHAEAQEATDYAKYVVKLER